MKKNWKHINFEQRKTISSCIAHNYKLVQIGNLLQLDPTSISKEVKRNRIVAKPGSTSKQCDKLNRWPFVCASCNLKYTHCPFDKYKYDAKVAQNKAKANLINSRRGLDLDDEEFKILDKTIKKGIEDNQSLYEIKIKNSDTIHKSLTTLYRYVNKGFLTTKRIDLPYAVKYKKRKHNKKYDYSNNSIDRSNHTYLDYLAFIHQNPRINAWQLDFLGSIKTDSKAILSLILPELQLIIINIIKNPNAEKVVKFFDSLEKDIGTEEFKILMPVILTDRDPCFSDINGICYSKITGEERCKLFFCDPYISSQKPNIENANKKLRKYFPKKSSVDKYTQKDIKEINKRILDTPVKSLDGYTPKEAFIKVYDEKLFLKLFK